MREKEFVYTSSYTISYSNMEEFISRKEIFKTLGLDYKPTLENLIKQQLGKFLPQETLEKIAQCYGVSVQEIEKIRKTIYNSFKSKFANNLINKNTVL